MRGLQAVIIWFVFIFYMGFVVFAVNELGLDGWQAVGLGAVLGVLLAMLKDMWQFYFRKKEEG